MRKLIRTQFVLFASQVCLTSFAFCSCCIPVLRAAIAQESSSLSPVLFTQVELRDRVLRPRQEVNQARTVWYNFRKCEETGRIDNFAIAGKLKAGEFRGMRYDDSDVYKVIEGAAASMAVTPDPKLDKYLDDLIVKIVAAQEPDGYLYTCRTIDANKLPTNTGDKRWSYLEHSHELYNVGHLYEAAAAHFQTTKKRNLLDVALKNADFICTIFGPGQSQRKDPPGHQEIELGLIKLYRVTGNKKYLDQAEFFLDARGRSDQHKLYGEYSQDHIPVSQQTEPVGHAVRAMYMYSAMAEIAALKDRSDFRTALETIWRELLTKKIYLTGGIGAEAGHEGFGPAYHLPNATAYNETCAAVGLCFWAHRMFLLTGESQYVDVLEQTLHNGLLSGVALDGERFFYPNPLESDGTVERQAWFRTSCCPVNIVRFLPAVSGLMYATDAKGVTVNLYAASRAEIQLDKSKIVLEQSTDYPWNGNVRLDVGCSVPQSFEIRCRIPGWLGDGPFAGGLYTYADGKTADWRLLVNGQPALSTLENGFAVIARTWRDGDSIQLEFEMPVRRVLAREEVVEDEGKFAMQRGPIVYCDETVANDKHEGFPDFHPSIKSLIKKDDQILGGIITVTIANDVAATSGNLDLIPYAVWANRKASPMRVWLPQSKK